MKILKQASSPKNKPSPRPKPRAKRCSTLTSKEHHKYSSNPKVAAKFPCRDIREYLKSNTDDNSIRSDKPICLKGKGNQGSGQNLTHNKGVKSHQLLDN